MKSLTKVVVFSDVDGTLLNSKYSYEETKIIVAHLVALDVPIILCSSKTRKELEYYQGKLDITAPFVCENGAAVFVPHGYFQSLHDGCKRSVKYDVIELGISRQVILEKFQRIRSAYGRNVVSFSDLTVEQLSSETGLSTELALLAKHREYSEPFRFIGKQEPLLFTLIEKEGLQVRFGGKYFSLSGNHTKGDAARIVSKLFREDFPNLVTIGVGNDANDVEMLNAVDYPFFIQNPAERLEVWRKIVQTADEKSRNLL